MRLVTITLDDEAYYRFVVNDAGHPGDEELLDDMNKLCRKKGMKFHVDKLQTYDEAKRFLEQL